MQVSGSGARRALWPCSIWAQPGRQSWRWGRNSATLGRDEPGAKHLWCAVHSLWAMLAEAAGWGFGVPVALVVAWVSLRLAPPAMYPIQPRTLPGLRLSRC